MSVGGVVVVSQPVAIRRRGGDNVEGVVVERHVGGVADDVALDHELPPLGLKLYACGVERQLVNASGAGERVKHLDAICSHVADLVDDLFKAFEDGGRVAGRMADAVAQVGLDDRRYLWRGHQVGVGQHDALAVDLEDRLAILAGAGGDGVLDLLGGDLRPGSLSRLGDLLHDLGHCLGVVLERG